jgi:hypothetical protein
MIIPIPTPQIRLWWVFSCYNILNEFSLCLSQNFLFIARTMHIYYNKNISNIFKSAKESGFYGWGKALKRGKT